LGIGIEPIGEFAEAVAFVFIAQINYGNVASA
jgi:hypothetical protein